MTDSYWPYVLTAMVTLAFLFSFREQTGMLRRAHIGTADPYALQIDHAMKPFHYLSTKLQQRCNSAALFCLLAPLFAAAPHDARACSVNGPPPVLTPAEELAAADVVLSGKIVSVNDRNFPSLGLRVEVASTLKGQATRVVQVRAFAHTPCGEGLDFLKTGQWWTLFLYQDKSNGGLVVRNVAPFCEKDATPAPDGAPGSCSKVLARAIEIDRFRIDAGSMVSVGPERSISAIQFARLQGRSSFAGVPLPPGTTWYAELKEVDLPRKLAIGPASMKGRILLIHEPDGGSMHGALHASLSTYQQGEITLYGAKVEEVRFSAPQWTVREARLSKPGVMRGIHIADYVTFTPDGKLASWRSGRDQVVNGVRLKKCDAVDLVDGRVVARRFENACAGR